MDSIALPCGMEMVSLRADWECVAHTHTCVATKSDAQRWLASTNAVLRDVDNRIGAVEPSGMLENATAFARYLDRQDDVLAAIALDNDDDGNNTDSLTLYHNASMINALPALVAVVQMAHTPQQRISVASHPLPTKTLQFDTNSFLGGMFMGMAFCFGVFGFAIDIVRIGVFFFVVVQIFGSHHSDSHAHTSHRFEIENDIQNICSI
jgi:hypothetical protein